MEDNQVQDKNAVKIEKLTEEYRRLKKVLFKGTYYPLITNNNIPLIEDVIYWLEIELRKKNITVVKKGKVNLMILEVGEMYFTTTKQIWCITDKWIANNKMFVTARKLYPSRPTKNTAESKSEDNRLFYEGAKGKASMDINIQKIFVHLKKEATNVVNIKQLTKN